MKLISKIFWAAVTFTVLLALLVTISILTRPAPVQEDYVVRQARTEASITQLKTESTAAQFWSIFWPSLGVLLVLLFVWAVVSEIRHRRRLNEALTLAQINTLTPNNAGNYPARITPTGVVSLQPGNVLQPVPTSLHYSPSTHTIYKGESRTPEQLPQPAPEVNQPTEIPTFAELLSRGEIGQGNKILLGYSGGKALQGSWLDLYSSAIAGVTGSGKTTTVRFLAAQSALQGAMFLLIDPHAGAGEDSLSETLQPLQAVFVCNPAVDADEISAAIHIANQEIEDRKSDKARLRIPYIIAVDEFTGLMRSELAVPLAQLLEKIAQEGRKYGVFALCMGQIWTASRSGGTELRDSFASKYVHRMARNQARLLIPTEEARLVERLPAGHAVLSRTNGELIPVIIPLTLGIDMERVAGILSAKNMPDVSQKHATIEAKPLNPDEARILSLFREGKDVAGIVKEVYGVSTNAGRNYQQLSQQVQAVIRRYVVD